MNTPEVLYKYYKDDDVYNEHRLGGELFFATPTKFNDIYDCQYVDIKNNTNEVPKEKALKIIGECGYSDKGANKIYRKLIDGDRTTIREVYETQQKHLGILCLTRTNTNMPMWGLYTNNEGYCIEYDWKTINEQLPLLLGNEMNGNRNPKKRLLQGKIVYGRRLVEPKLFLAGVRDIKKKYWHKLKEWSFEQEYRVGVSLGPNLKIKVKDCIKAVYFGPNIKEDRLNELVKFCPKNVGLYRMKKGSRGLVAKKLKVTEQ